MGVAIFGNVFTDITDLLWTDYGFDFRIKLIFTRNILELCCHMNLRSNILYRIITK